MHIQGDALLVNIFFNLTSLNVPLMSYSFTSKNVYPKKREKKDKRK